MTPKEIPMKLEPEIERALAYALAALEKVHSPKADAARRAIDEAYEAMRKQGWEPRARGWAGDLEGEVESGRRDQAARRKDILDT